MMMRAAPYRLSSNSTPPIPNKGKQSVSRIIERLDVVALLFFRGVRGCYFQQLSALIYRHYFPK
eukprot:scaffold38516_cov150-Skeletonema_dohrnii-CCMP3373.AAC.1